MCSKAPLILEVCIYITICVNGVLEHGEGTMFYRLKMGGQAYNTWNTVI